MLTIYDLLEVSEDASKEEIERSFERLLIKYQTNPNLDEKANKENEFILNKLKMAHDILIDDEKRKKYDNDLAKKRAENLIKNVSVQKRETSENQVPKVNDTVTQEEKVVSKIEKYDEEFDDSADYDESSNDTEELSTQEKMRLRKAAKKEFNRKLEKVKKAEEEYNNAYNKVYKDYMKKMGYKSKMPAPIKKFITIVVFILVMIIVGFIAWHIPPVKEMLVELYNENTVVRILTDFIITTVKTIFSKN